LKRTVDRHKQIVSEGKVRTSSVAPEKSAKKNHAKRNTFITLACGMFSASNSYILAIKKLIKDEISIKASVVKI